MKTIKIGDDPSVYATGNYNCKTSTTGTSIPKQKPKELDWEKVAFLFHNTYEGLATKFGYETRKDTKEFDPESNNGKLMIATCKAVISKTIQQQREDYEFTRKEIIDWLHEQNWKCEQLEKLLIQPKK